MKYLVIVFISIFICLVLEEAIDAYERIETKKIFIQAKGKCTMDNDTLIIKCE
jgi:hypothetical protein